MAKSKLRYREPILKILQESPSPVSLKGMLRALFSKEEASKHERNLSKELRIMVKMREIERGQGDLFRIRPPKNSKIKIKQEKEHRFYEREDRQQRQALKEIRRDQNDPRAKVPAANLVRGKVSKNSRGFAFVSPINPPAFLKEDVFLNPEEAEDLLTGDIVDIKLDRVRSEKGHSGQLVKVVERGMQKTVARYVKSTPFASPMAEVESKDAQLQIELQRDPTFKDLADGSAILVEIIDGPRDGNMATGKIISVLADSLNSTTDDPYIITKHKLWEFFPDEVLAEVEKVSNQLDKADYKGREDLRELAFVTIDGADSRDFDDAVYAERTARGYRLWVAVADVAHYVRTDTALDAEAFKRGTSVYFPHRVLPMLPEKLSNGICSLNPQEDRLVMVAEMEYDGDGRKLSHKVYEAVFKSHHRCVYETLQRFYDEPKTNIQDYSPKVQRSLLSLFELYKKMLPNRIQRGAIDLNLPEAKVKVNRETGEVDTIIRTTRMDTHRLIEEFMIAANEAVSEWMVEQKLPFIFRVHEVPEEDAVNKFLEVARSLQVRIQEKWLKDISPQSYQLIVGAIEESPAARVLNFLLLRSMKQAYYSAENLGHFGLASTAYSHFTSPIRRYPDLVVHRLLKAKLHNSKKEAAAAKGTGANSLEESAQHCSQRERAAVDAERELTRIKQVRYAERHLGEEHTGTVVGVNPKGAYVELTDVFVEGFVPIERFGPDFQFNDKSYHLRGKRTGKIIQIGDLIDVQIVRTSPHLLQIELEPLQDKPKRKKSGPTPVPSKERVEPIAPKTPKVPPPAQRDYWTPEDFE